MTPRGIRNCNPCNIRISNTRYLGEVVPSQDRSFKQFENMAYGYRAVFVCLHSYYKKRGLKTIRQMINRWAPPCENDTGSYVRHVSEATLHNPDTIIDIDDRSTMVMMVAAMSKVENGIPANIDDIVAGWELYKKHKP